MSSVNSIYAQMLAQPAAGTTTAAGTSAGSGTDFSGMLRELMSETSEAENASAAQNLSLLAGTGTDIHSVVLAAEKAEIALRLTLQIRNKVLDAYSEIMRMQV